ncbi:MAG: hypothetical protein ABI163_05805 [Thermoanaerobaculia bacterium]
MLPHLLQLGAVRGALLAMVDLLLLMERHLLLVMRAILASSLERISATENAVLILRLLVAVQWSRFSRQARKIAACRANTDLECAIPERPRKATLNGAATAH